MPHESVVMVGEHSVISEATGVSRGGEDRKANVGISNENGSENLPHRKTKDSTAMSINGGLVGT